MYSMYMYSTNQISADRTVDTALSHRVAERFIATVHELTAITCKHKHSYNENITKFCVYRHFGFLAFFSF